MTKADLVEQVARKLQRTQRQTADLVTRFWQSIMDALETGDKVEIRGFGSFRARARRPRLGRNPTRPSANKRAKFQVGFLIRPHNEIR